MSDTVTRRACMCLSVRGAIREISAQRKKTTFINDDKGNPLTKAQALNALMDELTKGHEVVPMSEKCGSPCSHSEKCEGFDFSGGGCPGYVIENNEAAI